MDITHITSLLGGVALFLYGMSIMGAGLEKLAGGKMQGVLQKLTSSTIKGVIFGTLITGVIQSSAGTVVICVGLVNSGIIPLTFADPADYDAINLLDEISLPNVLEEVKNGEQVTVVCGGKTFKADCEVSERQRHALLAGSTLLYARQQNK